MHAENMKAYRVRTGRQKTVTLPVSVLAGLLDADEIAAAIADGKVREDCTGVRLVAAISGYLGPQMVKAIREAKRDD